MITLYCHNQHRYSGLDNYIIFVLSEHLGFIWDCSTSLTRTEYRRLRRGITAIASFFHSERSRGAHFLFDHGQKMFVCKRVWNVAFFWAFVLTQTVWAVSEVEVSNNPWISMYAWITTYHIKHPTVFSVHNGSQIKHPTVPSVPTGLRLNILRFSMSIMIQD